MENSETSNDTATNNEVIEKPKESEKKDKDKQKIDILLQPTGNAPIMKQKKWSVDAKKTIGMIVEFVTKYLKLNTNERIFLYVNQTFAPSPDQLIKTLHDCYSTNGTLVLHYCKTQAWG